MCTCQILVSVVIIHYCGVSCVYTYVSSASVIFRVVSRIVGVMLNKYECIAWGGFEERCHVM